MGNFNLVLTLIGESRWTLAGSPYARHSYLVKRCGLPDLWSPFSLIGMTRHWTGVAW